MTTVGPGNSGSASGAGWPVYDERPPFLDLSWQNGQARAAGQFRCRLGTAVPRKDGRAADGVYAGWSWDGTTLTAQVDPHGVYSLFLYQKGDRLALSPSILQLIAQGADPELDRRALAVFYRLGLFINQDTPFRHIKVLPPGAHLAWRAGSVNMTSAGIRIPPVQQMSRDDAIEGLIALTRKSVANILGRSDHPLVLPLSGGRDSRHILLALDHLGHRPELCVTFQHAAMSRDSDSQAARALCERMGMAHRVLARHRSRPRDLLRCQVLTSLCSDEHMQIMPLHDFLETASWSALDGIAGDILTNPDDDAEGFYRLAQAGDFAGIARGMMAGHSRVAAKPGHPEGAGGLYAAGQRDAAVAYVTEALASCADAADPYQAYWFWHRTRREIGFVSSALFGTAAASFAPFLDQDLVDFGLSLPFSVTRDQQLHNDALRQGYPAYADLGFAEAFPSRPRPRRNLRRSLITAVQGIATLLALRPDHPLGEIARYLEGPEALHRRPGEVYQMHSLILSGLDAALAGDILDLARTYRRCAPRVQVSDRYDPPQG